MDALVDLIGVEVLDVDAGGEVFALEALDVLAHVAEADRVDGRDLDGGAGRGAALRMVDSSSRYCSTNCLQPFVVGLSEGRQLQRPLEPVDQLDPESLFELADDQTGRRLGEAVGRRRPRDGAAAGHVAEDLQRFQAGESAVTSHGFHGVGHVGRVGVRLMKHGVYPIYRLF